MNRHILYLGQSGFGTTSEHRINALRRLGNEVSVVDLLTLVHVRPIEWKLHLATGYRFLQSRLHPLLAKQVSDRCGSLDLVWVNGGELLGVKCLQILKGLGLPIVLYNNDDPTGKRDGQRFAQLRKAMSKYDLCVVPRSLNVDEYYKSGAKQVLLDSMSYDELAHRPFENHAEIPEKFKSEVAFIGTWMRNEKRDEFIYSLIKKGVPISVWGQRWEKSRIWDMIKKVFRGGSLSGRDYTAAVQGAKVCLGLLSKGNRDEYTQRSLEVPFAGGLLCAERTPRHLELFEDNVEAVFWSDVDECAEQCFRILEDDQLRESVRLAGMSKIRSLGLGNEDVCRRILNAVNERQLRGSLYA